jgi:putative FmdB family regulatory protein
MPIYEYEPDGWTCYICDGKVEVMQAVDDAPLEYCPTCGLEVRKVISKASIKIAPSVSPEKAAQRGFTTFRRLEKGKFEKIAGEGPEILESQG